MKKVLEILQYGDMEFRYNTDLKLNDHPEAVPNLISGVAFSMMTSLWGGNEQDILGVIRALSIADLAVSTNRKEMIKMMDRDSAMLARALMEAHHEFVRKGGKAVIIPPNMTSSKVRS
ncbi:MAG: hypothetical protein J6Y63_06395 [Bacteroidales bacterium]|nr:hypothetical protein [Bacteroidales bacterium]